MELGEDALSLLVQHITESKRPARTILRTLDSLSRTCRAAHAALHSRLGELRGLPVDAWEATSRSVPAQLSWTVEGFHELEQERIYSPPFRHGPHTWRLLLFPGGDDVERHRPGALPHLSLYVDVADAAMLPYGWVREAHFVLSAVNRRTPSKTIVRYARHDFEATARDWGFRELVPLGELDDHDRSGFLPGGALTLTCKVWGVTDTMRVAERAGAAHAQPMRQRGDRGGSASAVGASTASSTSMGSEDSNLFRRRPGLVSSTAFAALRRRLSSLWGLARRGASVARPGQRDLTTYRELSARDPGPIDAFG